MYMYIYIYIHKITRYASKRLVRILRALQPLQHPAVLVPMRFFGRKDIAGRGWRIRSSHVLDVLPALRTIESIDVAAKREKIKQSPISKSSRR